MTLQVPSVQIEGGGVPMLQGGSVTPQQDTVTGDIKKLGQAQQQAGQQISAIAEKLQDERDDAVFKEKHNEYVSAVSEKKLEYARLQGKNAIEKVGEREDGSPITRLDQVKQELTDLMTEFEGQLENEDQKYMFRTASASTLNSASTMMTKHEIIEGQKYQNAQHKAGIDLAADTTGQSYEDWHDPEGEFKKNALVGLKLIADHGMRTGMSELQIQAEVVKFQNKVHSSTLNQMMGNDDYLDAKAYLEQAVSTGNMDAATYSLFAEKVEKGYDEFKGKYKANALLNFEGNTNDGNALTSINRVLSLDSFNQYDNGAGEHVEFGHVPSKHNTNGMTEENAKVNLENLQKTSKFYVEGKGISLEPQHQTSHLFMAQIFGVEKADQFFSKAKKDLGDIDKERMKTDATYAKQVNQSLLEGAINYANDSAKEKFTEDNSRYANIVANDLEILKGETDYTGEQIVRRDDKTGLELKADLKKKLKERIQDKDQLEYALAELDSNYDDIKTDREEEYDADLEEAYKIAFAKPNGFKDIKDIDRFLPEDITKLKNGHPEKSETSAINELLSDPMNLKNIEQYRHRLTQSDYFTYKQKAEKLGGSSSGANYIEASGDAAVFKDQLRLYDLGDLLGSKENQKAGYNKLMVTWENEIDLAQIANGNKKISRGEKTLLLKKILEDKVFRTNSLNRDGGVNRFLLSEQALKAAYVKVVNPNTMKVENVKLSSIPKDINTELEKQMRAKGLTVTGQTLVQKWVDFGKPRNLDDLEEYVNRVKTSDNFVEALKSSSGEDNSFSAYRGSL